MNNDLISRSALEAKAKTIYMEFDNVAVPTRVISIADLHLAPTVDAVPMDFHESCLAREVHRRFEAEQKLKDAEPVRHGWWLKDGSIGAIGNYCSLCDMRVKPDANYNYCPNCGAKMDAETSE